MKAAMPAMSRVIRVGAQHSGNQAVKTFSFMSRRPWGRLTTSAPFDTEYVYSTYILERAESQGALDLGRAIKKTA